METIRRAGRCSFALLPVWTVVLAVACAPGDAQTVVHDSCHPPLAVASRVLVFTRTAGYRHGSIPDGVRAIEALGRQLNFAAEHTEDPAWFSDSTLVRFRAVVFLSTTGDVLDEGQQAAFERFVEAGGGFAGVHAAADTEYEWPWYGQLVGAWFARHPAIQPATLAVTDSTHPSTRCLPVTWARTDEWYDFRASPPESARVLMTIDEGSYRGGQMGPTHPMSWARLWGGGRSWYTALGHTRQSYGDATYLDHLAGGILWVIDGER